MDSLSYATSLRTAVVSREDSSPRELFFPLRRHLLSSRHLVPRWGPSSRLEQILPAWSKQRRGLARDLEGLVRNDGDKAATDLEAARDVNSATCDFVDYWRVMEL